MTFSVLVLAVAVAACDLHGFTARSRYGSGVRINDNGGGSYEVVLCSNEAGFIPTAEVAQAIDSPEWECNMVGDAQVGDRGQGAITPTWDAPGTSDPWMECCEKCKEHANDEEPCRAWELDNDHVHCASKSKKDLGSVVARAEKLGRVVETDGGHPGMFAGVLSHPTLGTGKCELEGFPKDFIDIDAGTNHNIDITATNEAGESFVIALAYRRLTAADDAEQCKYERTGGAAEDCGLAPMQWAAKAAAATNPMAPKGESFLNVRKTKTRQNMGC